MKGHILKIQLNGVKPPTWRRVWIPEHISFKSLSDIINIAFEWSGYHLHNFGFYNSQDSIEMDEKSSRGGADIYGDWGLEPEPWEEDDQDAGAEDRSFETGDDMFSMVLNAKAASEHKYRESETDVDDFLYTCKSIQYVYDFGDYWLHKIVLEKDEEREIEDGLSGVRLIKYKGDPFMEDSGGVYGQEDGNTRYEADPEMIQYELDTLELMYVAPENRHGGIKPLTHDEYIQSISKEMQRQQMGAMLQYLPPEVRTAFESAVSESMGGFLSEGGKSDEKKEEGNDDDGGNIIRFPTRGNKN